MARGNGHKNEALAASIGAAVAEALRPQLAKLSKLDRLDDLVERVDVMATDIAVMKDDISEMKGDISEMKGQIGEIRAVAIERHLDLDQRLRKVEKHLGFD